jgi:SEC-C motif-containing protein
MENCPCGTAKSYPECCGIYISGQTPAPTPLTLMRSRYTAYSKTNIEYIQQTMTAPANIDFNPEEAKEWAASVSWLGLEIVAASQHNDRGSVEFIAHFSHAGQQQKLHEISEFHLIHQHWYYVHGTDPQLQPLSRASRKIQRNEMCRCGSQKKFKKCCGLTA